MSWHIKAEYYTPNESNNFSPWYDEAMKFLAKSNVPPGYKKEYYYKLVQVLDADLLIVCVFQRWEDD